MTKDLLQNLKEFTVDLLAFVMVFLSSCSHSGSDSSQHKIDSLSHKVDSLEAIVRSRELPQKELPDQDTAMIDDHSPAEKKTEISYDEAPPAPPKEKKAVESKPKAVAGCEGCQYYTTGELSVKTDPMDGSMKTLIHFYNKKGVETYVQEDVSQSYSEHTSLEFRPDGSVSKATISLNPGASQYWYQQTIYFDEENYPLKRYSARMPYEDLQAPPKTPESWDRVHKKWIRE
jgi:hypothetical protein